MLDLLDADVYSSELDVVKPHADAFLAACQAVGVEPANAVYVGDRLYEDVHGPHQVGMVVVTVVLLLALFAFFRFTPLGLAMRAAAQNPASARLAGVRVDWMLALGWGLAAAIGAVAGSMVAPAVYLEPNMMASILLYAFAGALVGGISSPGGAVAGGFIVGVLENLVAYFGNLLEKASGIYIIGNGEKLTVALIIVIAVLTLKPSGIFGHVTVKRV